MVRFIVKMSGFETINRYCIMATLDVNGEMFISVFENWVWSIVWWLNGFVNCIMPGKDMCSC